MVAKSATQITEARVGISIGSLFKDEWIDAHRGLGSAKSALEQMKSNVLAVGQQADKIAGLPREHRPARIEGLARQAKTALESIQQIESRVALSLTAELSDLARESRTEIASVRGTANEAFAAAQVRDVVRGEKVKSAFLGGILEDVEAVRAVLSAPPTASGLTAEQHRAFWMRAEEWWVPALSARRRATEGALEEVRRSAKVARQLLVDSTGLERRGSSWASPWEMVESGNDAGGEAA